MDRFLADVRLFGGRNDLHMHFSLQRFGHLKCPSRLRPLLYHAFVPERQDQYLLGPQRLNGKQTASKLAR